jgi:non-specific serine/threonine protein kinase
VVVETLGLHLVPDQPLLETLVGFIQARQMLLILDNCEHLSDACAQLAQSLLSQAPGLRILATSRVALAIAGETIYPVPGLGWPVLEGEPARAGKSRLNLQELMIYDAVRLFVERARTSAPNFELTPENAWPTIEICRRLDGLPLALELASARANVLTVQEIQARLNDRFALLISGQRRGMEPRHQTLRAAIDWSFTLLTAREQTLLSRMAVFAAGCSLDTAEAVCSGEGITAGQILETVSSLVSKSLVIAETTGRAQARYRILETIREYALEKLEEAGEARRIRDRHLDLFLVRTEEAGPRLGDAYQQLWLNWLEGEHDNLRAALGWALESGRIEDGLRIATAVFRFWEIRGYLQEGMTSFERLLARADERTPLVVRASASAFASFYAMFLGDASAATSYGRAAVAFAEAAGNEGTAILPLAMGGLSSGARAAGDFQTAFDIDEKMIPLVRESGDPFMLGMALLSQGDIAIELEHFEYARTCLEESLALASEAGDAFRSAHAHNTLGDLARCQGNYSEAHAQYEKSAALLRELGAQHDLASIFRNQGRTCLHLGDIECAHTLFNESLTIHQMEHHREGMAECLIGFASVAIRVGMPAAGVRLLAAAAANRKHNATYVWPTRRMEYAEYLELARARLSKDELEAEQAAGQAMSLEQAIEYAHKLPLLKGTAVTSERKPEDLTGREREVAALIARGLSNREIADKLVLSPRTVEKHTENILSKLGLTSRAQIVRWAVEGGSTQAPDHHTR